MNEIEKLKREIQELKDWKRSLEASHSIPLNIDQAFRARFSSSIFAPTGTGSAASQLVTQYSVPSTPAFVDVTTPANPSGTLKINFNGTTYELLYK